MLLSCRAALSERQPPQCADLRLRRRDSAMARHVGELRPTCSRKGCYTARNHTDQHPHHTGSVAIGRNYPGKTVGLTPSALVGFNTTTLFNADDQSLRELAVVNWSIMDDLDFQFGTNFGAGGAGSEFEGFKNPQNGKMFENPDFVFAFLKAYF